MRVVETDTGVEVHPGDTIGEFGETGQAVTPHTRCRYCGIKMEDGHPMVLLCFAEYDLTPSGVFEPQAYGLKVV